MGCSKFVHFDYTFFQSVLQGTRVYRVTALRVRTGPTMESPEAPAFHAAPTLRPAGPRKPPAPHAVRACLLYFRLFTYTFINLNIKLDSSIVNGNCALSTFKQ